MASQTVFIVLAIIAGLVVGVGIGYLVNINQVNSLNAENAYLRYQVSILQANLTTYNTSYQTLQTLYNTVRNSYQALSLEYSDLNLQYNSAMRNLQSMNATLTVLTYMHNDLVENHVLLLATTYNATYLPNGTYYAQALTTLGSANSSVYVVMYDMKYDPGDPNDAANELISALVNAKTRGVDVKVVLDDNTLQQYPETISFLQNWSVPVRLDPSNSTTTHAKLVVVDGNTALIGSENWTESGLSYNNEFAVMLKGNMTVPTGYFMNLWDNGRPP